MRRSTVVERPRLSEGGITGAYGKKNTGDKEKIKPFNFQGLIGEAGEQFDDIFERA